MLTVTKEDDLQYVIDFDEQYMSDLTLIAQRNKLSVETLLYRLILASLHDIASAVPFNSGDQSCQT